MRRSLLPLLLASLTLAGCGEALPCGALSHAPAAFAAQAAGDLYPLVVGSHWDYALDQQQNGKPTGQQIMTVSIASSQPADGGATMAVMNRSQGNFSPPATRVLRYPDRVVLSRLSDPIDGPSITILHTPFKLGQSWPGRDFGGGNTETIMAAERETVTVPAGTYHAYRTNHLIRYANGATDTLSYWYAPGVGVVKLIERSTLWDNQGNATHLMVTGRLKDYVTGVSPTPALKLSGNAGNSFDLPFGIWLGQ